MWLHDAVVCCYSQCDSICPSPGPNHRLCNWQKHPPYTHRITEPCFMVSVIQQFVALLPIHHIDSPIQRFQTLIRQSKGLHSTVLLSSLCTPWPIETFWHCYASSIGNPHTHTQTITEPPLCFMVSVIQQFVSLFPILPIDPPIQRFQTLIRQSKGHHSTVLLSCLCTPCNIETFWHCYAFSTVVSW